MNPHELLSTYTGNSTNNYPLKTHSTYTRVSDFGQNLGSKMALRLICGSTYTRVYTVSLTIFIKKRSKTHFRENSFLMLFSLIIAHFSLLR